MAKWEEKYGTQPVYSLNKYIQDKLVEMEFIDITKYRSDLIGTPDFVIPFLIPGQELPEVETIYDNAEFKDLSYGIYSISHRYCADEPWMLCGQVAYSLYHSNMDVLIAMAEYLVDLLGREDWTASDINVHFRASTTYPFEFKNVCVLTSAGPAPAEDEGGRNSFMLVVKYDAVYEGTGRQFTLTLGTDTNYFEQGLR